jgi:hypothetical protein
MRLHLQSFFSRQLARDICRSLGVMTCSASAESFYHADAVRHFAILAHFPLAFEPRDDKAETDNAAQHDLDIALRGI